MPDTAKFDFREWPMPQPILSGPLIAAAVRSSMVIHLNRSDLILSTRRSEDVIPKRSGNAIIACRKFMVTVVIPN
jgi:hypothetical protein